METATEKEVIEKTSSSSEVKEDVVIIDGKPRPLKNFMAERERKIEQDVIDRLSRESRPVRAEPKASDQSDSKNWQKEIVRAAEREMEETGSIIPVNTMLNLVGQGVRYQLQEHTKTAKNAQTVIKEVKKNLKSEYKDYSDFSDEFEDIVDTIDPNNVSKEGLKIIFNSLRGQRMDDIMKKREEAAVKKAGEDRKIVGEVTVGTSTFSSRKSEKLNSEQLKEMDSMGFDSEEDYFGRLEKKRSVAKSKGAKNVPQTISEILVL